MAFPSVSSSVSTSTSLLSRLRSADDHEAWRQFEAKYRELILRYCRRKGLKEADADDVRQLVMMRLMKALPGFIYQPDRGRFRDYLYRTLHHVIVDDFLRPKAAGRPVLEGGSMSQLAGEAAAKPDEAWEQEWVDHHYRLAMATVRETFERQSVEIFDRLLHGEAVEAVAQSFATTTQAVHKVKQRIRDRIQELIAGQIRDEEGP